MISFSKKNLLLASLALVLCQSQMPASGAAPDRVADTFPNPVIASGTGFQITRNQLADAFTTYSAGVAANGGSIPEDQRDGVKSNLLQHLIITQILVKKATPDDKTKIQTMVQENIDEARRTAPSPEAFDAQIKASGMTLEQVKQRAIEEQLCRRILQRETTNGISISDSAAKKFYDDNPSKFEVPEEVRVAHILISTLDPGTRSPLPPDQKKAKEKLARDLRTRAMNGEDFGKLVKQYSEDPGSKDKGGEYKFPKGQMVPEFEAAAFSLKVGQISDPVETQYGYHIIKLLEKFPAKHEQFAEVSPKIKDYLLEKKAEDALPAYLEKIKSEAGVKIFTNKLANGK
jgi:peptidyl-prolyl cis-trans isomerase C